QNTSSQRCQCGSETRQRNQVRDPRLWRRAESESAESFAVHDIAHHAEQRQGVRARLRARCDEPVRSQRDPVYCGPLDLHHHHPDHNVEYGPFLLIGWVQGLPPSMQPFGPPPLAQMSRSFVRAYKATIDFWVEDLKVKPLVPPVVKEVSAPGTVMQDDHVRVATTLVQHSPVRPALAYRFDFPDRSIAFSGDTAPLEAVAALAKGASVLVHEAMYVPALEAYIRKRIATGVP